MHKSSIPFVPSPCISVCRMDAEMGLCAGCLRTLDEIAAWSTLDDEAKRRVWLRIESRQQEHQPVPGAGELPPPARWS
jgi:predicted Fe-S protein YdhL (DUF1289 family)